MAIKGLKEMHRRGITVLPGTYGFIVLNRFIADIFLIRRRLRICLDATRDVRISNCSLGEYSLTFDRYARDLEHFVKLLDFTPMEALVASTAGVAKLFMREDELGKVREGYFADLIIIDGNPLDDIKILQVQRPVEKLQLASLTIRRITTSSTSS